MRNVLLAASTHNVFRSAPDMPLLNDPQCRQRILRPAGKRSRGTVAVLCRIPSAL